MAVRDPDPVHPALRLAREFRKRALFNGWVGPEMFSPGILY